MSLIRENSFRFRPTNLPVIVTVFSCQNVASYQWKLTRFRVVFTARNISCGKVMFSQACVILSVHGGGLHLGRVCPGGLASGGSAWGVQHPGGSTSRGVCILGGLHPRGSASRGFCLGFLPKESA